jgi:hypothetical protein
MSWAARRRFLILSIVGTVALSLIALIAISAFYETPSCTDGKQNQGEGGIDCSGPCSYVCTADAIPPTVLFTKALTNSTGRTDVVALIDNKNPSVGAKNVPYRVMLYGSGQILLQERTGLIDLPPGATVPIFIAGAATGKQSVTNAFLQIDSFAPRWFTTSDTRIVPLVSGTRPTGTIDAPRIEATLSNPSVTTLTNVQVVVFVRDSQKEVIAASKTIVPIIRPQSSATAIFTWNSPFTSPPASIDVIPVVPLP